MNSALESLREILVYISIDNPHYAEILEDRIFEMVDHLRQFPKIGRKVPEYNSIKIREIIYRNYRIIYQLKENFMKFLQ